jgi:wobble nucleotide-excising tRNase
MITALRLLRNIGPYDSVDAGGDLPLAPLTLIYAENGRGKTTLAAILRALASRETMPVTERRRLGSEHPPHIVLDVDGGETSKVVFRDDQWTGSLPAVAVFDDIFVDTNVYSGLTVESAHRHNLHELIIGQRGVSLGKELQTLVDRIGQHNAAIRSLAADIPETVRAGFSIDQYCALIPYDDIDGALAVAERDLEVAQAPSDLRNAAALSPLSLPTFDLARLKELLAVDLPGLDEVAMERVEAHLATIGPLGEAWIAAGIRKVAENDLSICPFCALDLADSPVLQHYRTFFSEAYAEHVRAIEDFSSEVQRHHSGDVVAKFERTVRDLGERNTFWGRYVTPLDLELETADLAHDWQSARDGVVAALAQKQASPLEPLAVDADLIASLNVYTEWREQVRSLNERVESTNTLIDGVKSSVAAADIPAARRVVEQLRAAQSRFTPEMDIACQRYSEELRAKAETEAARERAKTALNEYRIMAFPDYQFEINQYLDRFNAGFRLDQVKAADTGGGPTCNYSIMINNTAVPVSGQVQPGRPSFRNTLSSGDRNTLALALFFVSLDRDPELADRIIVIDDPVSSLDSHRTSTTVDEIAKLIDRVRQVIVLSHNKPFLCQVEGRCDRRDRSAIEVRRAAVGSTLQRWNVTADSLTDHDRNHTLLREYLSDDTDNAREVAFAIRPVLEAFLRVSVPEHVKPGSLLGPFIGACRDRIGTDDEILDSAACVELKAIAVYANQFHHDTNPAWATIVVNDGELVGFVRRTLNFVRPNGTPASIAS